VPTIKETVHHASGTYVKGTVLPASHELVKAGPELFDADDGPQVESATAAPGEKRSTKRSTKA
jgi:hypothetical protein